MDELKKLQVGIANAIQPTFVSKDGAKLEFKRVVNPTSLGETFEICLDPQRVPNGQGGTRLHLSVIVFHPGRGVEYLSSKPDWLSVVETPRRDGSWSKITFETLRSSRLVRAHGPTKVRNVTTGEVRQITTIAEIADWTFTVYRFHRTKKRWCEATQMRLEALILNGKIQFENQALRKTMRAARNERHRDHKRVRENIAERAHPDEEPS